MHQQTSLVNSLNSEALLIHSHLSELIKREIEDQQGRISFCRFMELALYAPDWGYYNNTLAKFGKLGDFTTAPESGPLFAKCLARSAQLVLENLAGKSKILELGAGSGQLAIDLLAELERLDSLPDRYLIWERSPHLQARQLQAITEQIPHLKNLVAWITEPPNSFSGLVIANEVLDAFPVTRFLLKNNRVFALHVGWDENLSAFCWVEDVLADDALSEAVRNLRRQLVLPLPEPYYSEINLSIKPWLQQLVAAFEQGVMLFVDYGYSRREYYMPERKTGTLTCHLQHQCHDNPLLDVGMQDITSYVDFTLLAEAGMENGLSVMGYTTQAHFLLGSGLDQILLEILSRDPNLYLSHARAAKALLLPGEMGERFRIMGFSKACDIALPCFSVKDMRDRL